MADPEAQHLAVAHRVGHPFPDHDGGGVGVGPDDVGHNSRVTRIEAQAHRDQGFRMYSI